MNQRKAFTLTELLVVIGVIVILIAILVPVIAHTRNQADIVAEKSDFQAISSALEAYRQDFGDYPRNRTLTTWNYDVGSPSGFADPVNYEAPAAFTLASALVGPGPASTVMVGSPSVEEAGDGASGPGFRNQSQVFYTTLSTAISPTNINFKVNTIPPGWTATSVSAAQLQQILTNTTVEIDPGSDVDETVGLDPAKNTPPSTTLITSIGSVGGASVSVPLRYPHAAGVAVLIKTATGKVWPGYLAADRFKIAYLNVGNFPNTNYSITYPSAYIANAGSPTAHGQAYEVCGQPVLLDRWGQIIQYFPRNGPNSNRTDPAISTYHLPGLPPGLVPSAIGPLLGYSSSKSIYPSATTFPPVQVPPYGMDSIWDTRDGIMFLNNPGGSVSVGPWLPSPTGPTGNYDPQIAFEWMLGDGNGDNLIDNGESLRYDGPFVLISAGPNQYRPEFGGFCNMLIGDGTATQIPTAQKADVFKQFGNIYNFDR